MSYYEKVLAMSPAVQQVCTHYWDEMGRPVSENSFMLAVVCLLNMSEDFETFLKLYKELFYEQNFEDANTMAGVNMCWYCYAAGMTRIVKEFEKRR